MPSMDTQERAVLTSLILRINQEKTAQAASTSDILHKLNVKIEALPQKYQQILLQTAENQSMLNIDRLEPVSLFLQQSKLTSAKLKDDYEILKLKQKNAEMQMKIDRNNKFLDSLRKELEQSRQSLESQTPNPENIQEHLRLLKLKLASYEENYDRSMAKFNNLSVPPHVYPKSLMALVATLASLQEEAASLQNAAEEVQYMREARDTINRLRR